MADDCFDDLYIKLRVDIEVNVGTKQDAPCFNILHFVDIRVLSKEEGAMFADCGVLRALCGIAKCSDRERFRVHPGGIGRFHVVTDQIVRSLFLENSQTLFDHRRVDERAVAVDLDADGCLHFLECTEHPTEDVILCTTERGDPFLFTECLDAIVLLTLGCCDDDTINVPCLSHTVKEVAEEWPAGDVPQGFPRETLGSHPGVDDGNGAGHSRTMVFSLSDDKRLLCPPVRRVIILWSISGFVIANGFFLMGTSIAFVQSHSNGVIFHQSFLPVFRPIKRTLDRLLDPFYRGAVPTEDLPLFFVWFDGGDLRVMNEKIMSVTSPYLPDDVREWVDGVFVGDGAEYAVKARVRGVAANHWIHPKKSWRVKLKDGRLFRGMRSFDLILPSDRAWFTFALNSFRGRKLGLFYPDTRFVQVSLNGSAPSLYLLVEHWEPEMFERTGNTEDINFYHPDTITDGTSEGYPAFQSAGYWRNDIRAQSRPFALSEDVDLFLSLAASGAHLQAGYEEKLRTLFDMDQLVAWYVHSLLAGNSHAHNDNVRVFFDLSRGRFVPVPWDVNFSEPHPLKVVIGNDLWEEVFRVPSIRVLALRRLWAYVNDSQNTEEDIHFAQEVRRNIERATYRDPLKFRSNREVLHGMEDLTRVVGQNLTILRTRLSSTSVSWERLLPSLLPSNALTGVRFTVVGRSPVAITEFRADPTIARAFRDGSCSLLRLLTSPREDQPSAIVVSLHEETPGVFRILKEQERFLWDSGFDVDKPWQNTFLLRWNGDTRRSPVGTVTFSMRNAVTEEVLSGSVLALGVPPPPFSEGVSLSLP